MPFVVKNTSFPNPLDLLFPHSCRGCGLMGEVLCERCKNHIIKTHRDICPNCKQPFSTTNTSDLSIFTSHKCSRCHDLPPIYVVGPRNTILGELIHDYKYHSIRALAKPLAELIHTTLPQSLPKNTILVPLPTASHHIRARGLDHTYLIAKHLGKTRHLSTKHILIRDKNTVQVGSDRTKRLTQAKSAYRLNPKVKINPNTTYILIDDIWTTGASVKAASNILKQAGAQNLIIALLAYSS